MRARSAAAGPAATVSQSMTTQPSGSDQHVEGMEVVVADTVAAVVEPGEQRHELGAQRDVGDARLDLAPQPRHQIGKTADHDRVAASAAAAAKCRASSSASAGLDAVSTSKSEGPSTRLSTTPLRPSTVTVPWGRATGSPASASPSSTVASKCERPFHSGRSSLSTRPSP